MTETRKSCLDCRHCVSAIPVICGQFTEGGAPRLAMPLRADAGPCGPEASFWQALCGRPEAHASATILQFPKHHRASA